MDKFTIVIPVYNEAKNLKVLIPKIYQELKNRKFEILVVDDNSTDMTSKILKKFKKNNFHHLIRKNERDLSKSCILGFENESPHLFFKFTDGVRDRPPAGERTMGPK